MTWFKNTFLKSFETCRAKRISPKQAGIFEKYLRKHIKEEINYDNGEKVIYEFENRVITLEKYSTVYHIDECYLSIS